MGHPLVQQTGADELEEQAEQAGLEFLRGEAMSVSPTGFEHGDLVLAFGGVLRSAARAAGVGRVVTEVGFRLADDVLLAPDLALVAPDAVPTGDARRRMVRGAPRLAVEIASPGQDAGELAEKIDAYLAGGALAVWILYPGRAAVAVHEPERPVRLLRRDDVLHGGDPIPGFAMSVEEIFRLVDSV